MSRHNSNVSILYFVIVIILGSNTNDIIMMNVRVPEMSWLIKGLVVALVVVMLQSYVIKIHKRSVRVQKISYR